MKVTMNKTAILTQTALFFFGLSDCPIKPVDTKTNGLERDWKNVGMDIQNVLNSYGEAK